MVGIVNHFKRQRLDELKVRVRSLRHSNSGLIRCAITGVAGCGKSELAKAYAWEFPDSPTLFRWRLDPDTSQNNASQVSYLQAYTALLANFRLDESRKAYDSETPEQIHQRLFMILWKAINQYSSWIVIFDNAVSYVDIQRYLPSSIPNLKGYVVVTTQTSNFFQSNKEQNFSINKGLHEDDAIELLKDLSHRKDNNARALVKELDYSPLGIRIVGSYIYNLEMTCTQYLQLLNLDPQGELLEEYVGQATEDLQQVNTLQRAIQLSILKAKLQNPALLRILESCGYLANTDIPHQLLLRLYQQENPSQQNPILTEARFKTMIQGKGNYSLLTYDTKTQCRNPETPSYEIHRTTQNVLRTLAASPMNVIQKLAAILLQLYPYDPYSIAKTKHCQTVEAHFRALSYHIQSQPQLAEELVTQRLQLLLILGQLAYRSSQFSSGLQDLQTAWKLVQAAPTRNVELQIQILHYLALMRYRFSQYSEARSDLERAIQLAEPISLTADWRPAVLYDDLGDTFHMEGRNQEALVALRKAKQICDRGQPRSRELELELANVYRKIGKCLQAMKDFSGGLEHLNQSLKLYQKYVDASGPWISAIYHQLGRFGLDEDAEAFEDRGIDYATSKRYLDQALAIYLATYELQHYYVANAYYWRSQLLYVSLNEEDWILALEALEQAIEIWIGILGDQDQQVIESYYYKGKILQKLNRDVEARDAYQQTVNLGQVHPGERTFHIQKSLERLQAVEQKLKAIISQK